MLQIRFWVTSYEVYGLVAAKLSWVDPASFAAMESDTHLLYFTELSGKSQDFYFLVGIHLNDVVIAGGSLCERLKMHMFGS